MRVSQTWLTNKISKLNSWLQANSAGIHFEFAANKQKRNYYVNKLIELEENGSDKIKI